MMNGVGSSTSPGRKVVPLRVVGIDGCKLDSATNFILGPPFPSNTITLELAVRGTEYVGGSEGEGRVGTEASKGGAK